MKKKSITLVLSLLFVLFSTIAISAQGLYSDDLSGLPSGDADSGGPLRGPGDDGPPAPEGPIGEGLLILTVLAGGYAAIKKRKTKNESL